MWARVFFIALVWSLAAPPDFVSAGTSLKPPPDADAQSHANQVVKEVFGQEYAAAKSPAQKRDLAGEMMRKALESEDDPAGQFVLLRIAKDVAAQGGDAELAVEAIEEIARRFQVDAIELKTAAIVKAEAAAQSNDQHRAAARESLALIDAMVQAETVNSFDALAAAALAAARGAHDAELLQRAKQRVAEVHEMSAVLAGMAAARAELDKTPDDPQANLKVGSYECFFKLAWETGVPMLALGNDADLKAIALKELQDKLSPEDQAALADAWWSAAEKLPASCQHAAKSRACTWYAKALPSLTGLMKVKAGKRIAETAQFADGAANPESAAKPATIGSGLACTGETSRAWHFAQDSQEIMGQLTRIDRDVIHLKRSSDGSMTAAEISRLAEPDRLYLSKRVSDEIERIWSATGDGAGEGHSPAKRYEVVKAAELSRTLGGFNVFNNFVVQNGASSGVGKNLASLHIGMTKDDKKQREILLPLTANIVEEISKGATLSIEGKMSFKSVACASCSGTGLLKCPNCSHGLVTHTENRPFVFPNGQRFSQDVAVSTKCPVCGGTGRHGECKKHDLAPWDPFEMRKAARVAFDYLSKSNGAWQLSVYVDDPRIVISTAGKRISLRKVEGKFDIQMSNAGDGSPGARP